MNKAEERLNEIVKYLENHSPNTIGYQVAIQEKQGILLGIEETKKEYEKMIDRYDDILDNLKKYLLEKLKMKRVCNCEGKNICENKNCVQYVVDWQDIEKELKTE